MSEILLDSCSVGFAYSCYQDSLIGEISEEQKALLLGDVFIDMEDDE